RPSHHLRQHIRHQPIRSAVFRHCLRRRRRTRVVCQVFLRKEDTAAFVWAFNNYVKWCCDDGWCPPGVILTDDAKSAAAAIRETMPSTKHFLCSWHLFKNLKEHTDKHLRGNPDLLRACRTAFRSAEYAATSEEFESSWGKLTALNLPDGMKTYLSGLHERREMWACYARSRVLTVGMTATSRVESFFAAFKAMSDRVEKVYGLSGAAQVLTALNLSWAVRAVSDAERAFRESGVRLDDRIAKFFPEVLWWTDTYSTALIQSKTRQQLNACVYYDTELVQIVGNAAAWAAPAISGAAAEAGASAATAGGSGAGTAAADAAAAGAVAAGTGLGAMAAAAAAPVAAAAVSRGSAGPGPAGAGAAAAIWEGGDMVAEKGATVASCATAVTDPDDPIAIDDRPRMATGSIEQAFQGRIISAFLVTPAGGGKSHKTVFFLNDKTHLCTCMLLQRYGIACRLFYAYRYRSGHQVGIPFIFDQWHPRWQRQRKQFARMAGVGSGDVMMAR
ncbi:unnamed protein product, partial [Phaeothamnion confervicola]